MVRRETPDEIDGDKNASQRQLAEIGRLARLQQVTCERKRHKTRAPLC